MYTGACWLDTLAGTLAIAGMGNQQGGASGYCVVRYKPETSPEQRPAPLHHVLTSPAAVGVTASEILGLQLSPNCEARI